MKLGYTDTETTGLDPNVHEVIQAAFIIEENGKILGENEFTFRPKNFDVISQESLDVNGITVAELKKYPPAHLSFARMEKWLNQFIDRFDKNDKMYPVGYNVKFDIQFMVSLFESNNNPYFGSYFNFKTIDLLSLMYLHDFMGTHKLKNYKLGTVSEHYGLSPSTHDAMDDVRTTRELCHKFLLPYITR